MPYMDPMGMVKSTVIPVFEWVNSSKKNISVAETNPIAGSWTCCRRRPTRSVWADSRASCARWRTRCGETFRGGGLGFLEKKLLGKYESSCGWFEIPIGSMYAIYMVTFTIYIPPMLALAYQHHGSVMGNRKLFFLFHLVDLGMKPLPRRHRVIHEATLDVHESVPGKWLPDPWPYYPKWWLPHKMDGSKW